jgi:hypothetical protein
MILKKNKTCVVKVECDRCHNRYTDPMEIQEFLYINFRGGYLSVFGDENTIKADICQHCLKIIIRDFYRINEE